MNLQVICSYRMVLFTECFQKEFPVSLVSFYFISHYIAMPFTNGDLSEHSATDNTSLNSTSALISLPDICYKNVGFNAFSSSFYISPSSFNLKANGVYVLVSSASMP